MSKDSNHIILAMKLRSGSLQSDEISVEELAAISKLFDFPIKGPLRYKFYLPDIEFEAGLTDSEVAAVEERFAFRFPPDLRAFLQTALPCGKYFPNWRSGDESSLREMLNVPVEGICFDIEYIEYNGFWLPEWGARPAQLQDALQLCRELVAQAPSLIPIHGHRYMPDEPHLAGNPVFSVHQADIIYYGYDLADYLRHDFHLGSRSPWPEQVRPIRFWNLQRFQEVRWARGSCITDPKTLNL